jgi:hypothetical protein
VYVCAYVCVCVCLCVWLVCGVRQSAVEGKRRGDRENRESRVNTGSCTILYRDARVG